jgi:protocatechuate 3,4-dioxygenase, alpha subunit
MTTNKQTPSMTVGPWFSYGLTPEDYGRKGLATGSIVGSQIPGQHTTLSGRVYDGAGKPVPDALLEIWQANANGRYAHAADARAAVPLQTGFTGFGRVSTNADGRYSFATIKPGRVPARGNVMQAPHLNLTVFARGLLSHLFTRLYFSDEAAANAEDPILSLVDPARRRTLVAVRGQPHGSDPVAYALDIHLQGDNETVFFEA